jgi:hypothetical protein
MPFSAVEEKEKRDVKPSRQGGHADPMVVAGARKLELITLPCWWHPGLCTWGGKNV